MRFSILYVLRKLSSSRRNSGILKFELWNWSHYVFIFSQNSVFVSFWNHLYFMRVNLLSSTTCFLDLNTLSGWRTDNHWSLNAFHVWNFWVLFQWWSVNWLCISEWKRSLENFSCSHIGTCSSDILLWRYSVHLMLYMDWISWCLFTMVINSWGVSLLTLVFLFPCYLKFLSVLSSLSLLRKFSSLLNFT